MKYFVLAYYFFTPIEDPQAEIKRHKKFLIDRDIRARIYINEQGINGQMSASFEAAEEYMSWIKEDARFKDIHFKFDPHPEHVFAKQTVKYRKQLAALDRHCDPADGGDHLSPEEWKKALDEKEENMLLIDVRNDYETKIGHFKGADLPNLQKFRQFPEYVAQLKEKCDPKNTKILMYCTAGIRCELYSVLFKDEGFEQVFQLEGGVVNYGHKVGEDHWLGKLFVFDDRLSVPLVPDSQNLPISHCHQCETPSDTYLNCANMDCNELFLSCKACAESLSACCSVACKEHGRVRPFEWGDHPKPYRKLPFEEKIKINI